MRRHRPSGKAELLATARAIARELQHADISSSMRIKMPSRAPHTRTDGWYTNIGSFGSGQIKLEIWLDRYSGYEERKLNACFRFPTPGHINRLTRRIPRTLTPIRTIVDKDYVKRDGSLVLVKRLARSEFDAPIIERYPYTKSYFFGIYGSSDGSPGKARDNFCQHAAAFFMAIAEAQGPGLRQAEVYREVYPQQENRQRIVSHIQRERRSLLAVQRKIRDEYECQICGFRFPDMYGSLGEGFAEAHHLDALSNFRGQVINDLADLATVCANCHRMLHRMSGRRADFAELRKIVHRHQRGRK